MELLVTVRVITNKDMQKIRRKGSNIELAEYSKNQIIVQKMLRLLLGLLKARTNEPGRITTPLEITRKQRREQDKFTAPPKLKDQRNCRKVE
jgi:hypothetical protein